MSDRSAIDNTATAPPSPFSALDTVGFELGRAPTPNAHADETAADFPRVPGYRILRELGRGGMGVVYEAFAERLRLPVALKVMTAALDGPVRERFEDEAAILARFDHPNIVRVFAAGEANGRPHFAMKLLSRGSLNEHRHTLHAGPAEVVVRLVATVARAVQVLHDGKVWHRDLKPQNILIGDAGEPQVADFGVAKWLEGDAHTLGFARVGTYAYMAPEMIAFGSARCGPPADVWSLGVILYELLAGERPFPGVSGDPALPGRVLTDTPLPFADHATAAGTDERLERIALRALAKDPAHRYPSAAALADDLDRWLGDGTVDTLPPLGALRRYAARAEPIPPRRRRWPLAVAAGVLLAVAAGVGVLLGAKSPQPDPDPTPAPPLTITELLERDGEVLVVDADGMSLFDLPRVDGSLGGVQSGNGFLALTAGKVALTEIGVAPPYPFRVEAEMHHEVGTPLFSLGGLYAGRVAHPRPAAPGGPPPAPRHAFYAVTLDMCVGFGPPPAPAEASGVVFDPAVPENLGYFPTGRRISRNLLPRHPIGPPRTFVPITLDVYPDRFAPSANGEAFGGNTVAELKRHLALWSGGQFAATPQPFGGGYGLVARDGTAAFRNVWVRKLK